MYNKRIFLNKKLLLILIGFPLFVFTCYIIFDILPVWDVLTGPDQYNAEKNYSVRQQFIIASLRWGNINNHAANLTVVYPFLILIGLMNFKEDLMSYFIIGRHRFKNYPVKLIQAIVSYSAIIALTVTVSHLLTYFLYSLITPVTHDITLESTAYIFNFLLPSDLFEGHPLYYYLSITLLNDLPIIFSFSILFSVFTLFTKESMYAFILVPLVFSYLYYFMSTNFELPYMDLSVPFLGYYSKITEIWKYTFLPLVLAGTGFIGYFKWGTQHDV